MNKDELTEQLANQLRQNGLGLGGSRRIVEKYPADITLADGTDWDFYCENTPERIAFIEAKGFAKVEAENREYWDELLLDIYKHESLPIEVLIRSDVGLYRKAFESVSSDEFVRHLWKSSPVFDRSQSKAMFRARVCDRFNRLFKEVAA